MSRIDRSKLLAEYADVHFGDARVDERLNRIVSQLAGASDDSFPVQMASDADQEALYRFLANPKVVLDKLLEGHRQQTHKRMSGRGVVRIAHDTTEFAFQGEREGLGVLKGNEKGFFGHFALAVTADETREALGVLGVRPFINTHKRRGLTASQQTMKTRVMSREEKKSSRWESLAIDVSNDLPKGVEAIHLMDQEADDYGAFSAMLEASLRFVIRGDPRRITAEKMRTNEVLARKPAQIFRNVPISARSKKQAKKKQHPARAERVAELSVRAATVTLKRPQSSRDAPLEELSLNAVYVFEASPPPGETAIEWMLFTSEPIDTLQELGEVVDHYRARWVIEEYFKALKTGCAFEERQLCSFKALVRALGLFVPMAWTLLALRTLGRETGNRPATDIFSVEQIKLLNALLESRRRKPLAQNPTIRDAMLGIAGLGGHIKNNGDPGWHVLGRGLRRLTEAEEGWNLALRSDQS